METNGPEQDNVDEKTLSPGCLFASGFILSPIATLLFLDVIFGMESRGSASKWGYGPLVPYFLAALAIPIYMFANRMAYHTLSSIKKTRDIAPEIALLVGILIASGAVCVFWMSQGAEAISR